MTGWSDPTWADVAERVGARAGLSFPDVRRRDAELAFARAMARRGLSSPVELARALDDASVLGTVLDEITVRETSFFRHPEQLALLRQMALSPAAEAGGTLRIWSAGCASGEEAYTMAILAAEAGRDAVVVGTDVAPAAIARARQGVYRPWSLRGLPDEARDRYFTAAAGGVWNLRPSWRRGVSFSVANLLDPPPYGARGCDVVLCRNVLVHFAPEAWATVARHLWDALADGGVLLTAAADPPLRGLAPFDVEIGPSGPVYRKPRRSPALAAATDPAPAPAPGPSPVPGPASGRGSTPVPPAARSTGAPSVDPRAADARSAFSRGDWSLAADLARPATSPEACAIAVRANANLSRFADALRDCADGLARWPMAVELHLLDAVVRMAAGRHEEAARAVDRALYVDPRCAAAWHVAAVVRARLGRSDGARRAHERVVDLCGSRPADEVVPLADGVTAGDLAAASRAWLGGGA